MKNSLSLTLAYLSLLIFGIGCSKPKCPPSETATLSLCNNGIKDAGETGIDCGGTCTNICNTKSVVLQPGTEGIDSYITNLFPDIGAAVYGSNVSAWTNLGTPYTSMVLFNFDYNSIPSSATIQSARLTLFADTTTEFHVSISIPKGHSQLSYSNEWMIKKITSPWDENLVTWNSMPQIDEASIIELPASSANFQAYTIDLTDFVKEEFSTGNHYGFRMEMKNKIPYNCVIFYSSDGPYPALRPKMDIDYY